MEKRRMEAIAARLTQRAKSITLGLAEGAEGRSGTCPAVLLDQAVEAQMMAKATYATLQE
jgi:hypothetical protein